MMCVSDSKPTLYSRKNSPWRHDSHIKDKNSISTLSNNNRNDREEKFKTIDGWTGDSRGQNWKHPGRCREVDCAAEERVDIITHIPRGLGELTPLHEMAGGVSAATRQRDSFSLGHSESLPSTGHWPLWTFLLQNEMEQCGSRHTELFFSEEPRAVLNLRSRVSTSKCRF